MQQGRLGTVAAAVVLPWLATAALGLGRTRRPTLARGLAYGAAGWSCSSPSCPLPGWSIAVVVLVAVVTGAARHRSRELAIVVLVPLLLVLPWAVATISTPGAWLVEAGRAGAISTDVGLRDLLLGRTGGPGEAPWWFAVGLPLAGLAAFLRTDTRVRVLRVWVVILAAAVVLVGVSGFPVSLPGCRWSSGRGRAS